MGCGAVGRILNQVEWLNRPESDYFDPEGRGAKYNRKCRLGRLSNVQYVIKCNGWVS